MWIKHKAVCIKHSATCPKCLCVIGFEHDELKKHSVISGGVQEFNFQCPNCGNWVSVFPSGIETEVIYED